ncbi:3-hydroxyacyl-CoA dehydrogenase NAD-binding domain-containing protein [Pseudorhodoplanes sp.]|uniref:3-hydroxyacyl-CoA dehydrogenase NAD-binding domain-containing protein n=1 Tax=Pseudorhodoplanes sp. TaxID=1934341 RepID=UPI002BADC6DA|nr:3-hydroxyacyl-CoA dehydrogenase NAD-binding domain-containing protein [Pseudorhodoplanes sp.]HWV43205.1 3-hydroxyacyl-CoA dehydrogenase NAD-binding domain-containing protein [Pseudorhodoplanes sp.]
MIRQESLGDGIALLVFDSPGPVNTLGAEDNVEFAALIDRLLADESVKGIVLTSEKRDFLAGGDLDQLRRVETPADAIAIVTPFLKAIRKLETGGKPVVAALNGTALGGGFELALACHRRIAADVPSARFGLPEVTLGLMPGGGGTQRLPRLIGIAAAAPLLLEGKRLKPADALAARIIDEVVPPDELRAAAKAWALANPGAAQPWDVKGYKLPGFAPQSAEGRMFFMGSWTRLHKRSAGCDLASEAILQVLHHGLERGLDAGIAIETRYFARLAASADAKAKIRTLFVGTTEAKAMKMRPKDVPPSKPARVSVIGGGVMGRGIAYVSAQAGMQVDLIDVSDDVAAKSRQAIAKSAERDAERGRLRGGSHADVIGRIQASSSYDGIATSDIVVEAVFERPDLKRDVLKKAAAVARPGTPIASNTSSIPISELASAIPDASCMIGLHFFSPVERMPLVEVVRTDATSDQTLARALDFLKAIDKTPVVVRDGLGFFTSRVVTTYSSETMNLLAEGVPPQLIDNAAINAGFALGPVSLCDMVTMPLLKDIFASMRGDGHRIADQGSVARETVGKLVDAGRVGKVQGNGVYSYDGEVRDPWDGLAACLGTKPSSLDETAVRERLLYVQSLEAIRTLEEGIVARPIDADLAAVLGWGYPAHLGGVFAYVDRIGAAEFARKAQEYADRFGGRFTPPAILLDMARDNRKFHAL